MAGQLDGWLSEKPTLCGCDECQCVAECQCPCCDVLVEGVSDGN